MSALLENILNRSRGQKVAIWLGTLALLCYLFWQYFYSSRSAELAELEQKKEALSAQVSHERRLAADLGKFRQELKVLQSRLDVALKQLPDSREIPGLLESVAALAKDSGLEVLRFVPGTDNLKDFYAEVPVQIDIRGTYHQMATFFDEIAGLSRVVNVNNVVLGNPTGVQEQSSVRLDAKCSVTTFRYLDPSERIDTESQADDTKKRKAAKKTKK